MFFSIFFFCNFVEISNAESCPNCKIKNGTAPILLKHILDTSKLISNIRIELQKSRSKERFSTEFSKKINVFGKDEKTKKTKKRYNKNIVGKIYNSLFNWDGVMNGWKIFLSRIDLAIPKAVDRDLLLLENQNDAINNLLKEIIVNDQYNKTIKINTLCKGIKDSNCKTVFGSENIKINEVIKILLLDNTNIISLIGRESKLLIGQLLSTKDLYNKLKFVPKLFKSKFAEFYGDASSKCSRCEGESLDRLKKSVDELLLNTEAGKKGINEWKDAWALMQGGSNYNEVEKKLLKEYLEKQGASSDSIKSAFKGLDNYNKNGLKTMNPIKYSFNLFKGHLEHNSIKEIKRNLEIFKNIVKDSTGRISTILKMKYGSDVQAKVKKDIDTLIGGQEKILLKQNNISAKLENRIIQMHINLAQTIKKLDGIIDKSVKICNSQMTGIGICRFR